MNSLKINKGVFNPYENTYSSKLIIDNLKNLEGKKVLDMGCGSRILGIESIKKGAQRVTFSDNCDKCLINTRLNLKNEINSKKYELVKSNLFEHIQGEYDLILANLPISDEYWNLNTLDIYEKFLKNVKNHIKKESSIYLTHSSFGNFKKLKSMIIKEKFTIKKVITKKMFDVNWQLIIFNFNK